MNNLLQKVISIFKTPQGKKQPPTESKAIRVGLPHADYAAVYPGWFFGYGSMRGISRRWTSLKRVEQGGSIYFFVTHTPTFESAHLDELWRQWLGGSRTELTELMELGEISRSRIRYEQKLAEIDRRMILLEEKRGLDSNIQLSHSSQLEHLEANVQSLKRGVSDQAGEVQLSDEVQRLLGYLATMEVMRDEPTEFEQARATFLGELRALERRKQTREPYFADLLTMIDVGITYVDGTELTEDSFAVLRDAVQGIPCEVTSDILRGLRKRFRDSRINILKPLDPNASIGELLKETFK